jgi:hypothetical protein
VERFIARQNISHFREELTSEVSPERRAALLRLLVMEEGDKLGLGVQQLGDPERYIAEEKCGLSDSSASSRTWSLTVGTRRSLEPCSTHTCRPWICMKSFARK